MIKGSIGNYNLLELPKTAFLCSRKISASTVLKCIDWAVEKRTSGTCVISGFHSQIEKDVLHYLLKGQQPIIVALARGIKQSVEPMFEKPLKDGRLLIITPFESTVKRVTEDTARIRNKMMLDIADNITVGFVGKGGTLENLLFNSERKIDYL